MTLFDYPLLTNQPSLPAPASRPTASRPLFRLLILLLALASVFELHASSLTYSGQNGLPEGYSMSGSAYGNNAYVVVGSDGYILRSTDGHAWTIVKNSSYINTNYNSVIFAQGLFVAVAANGEIITSADGINWSLQTSGTANQLVKIAYLNGKFFAIGGAGTVLTSANGTNWTAQSLGAGNYFVSITYGNGKYLMSSYTSGGGYLYSSTTGTSSWTSSQISTVDGGTINFVGWLNNKFYAFLVDASVWTSTDGASWTQFTKPPIIYPSQVFGGLYTNGTYYFYGSDTNGTYGAIFTSTDGTNFTENLPKTFTDVVNSLSYGNGLFIETGNNGWGTSTDANHWRFPAGNYQSVAYNGTNYVAVGYDSDGYITTSPDWVNWTNTTPATGRFQELNSVVASKGKFVAVGYNGNGQPYAPIVTSTDGYNWTVTNTTVVGASGLPDNLLSIAADGNGTLVAVGDQGHVIRSTDNGVTWSAITPAPAAAASGLVNVAYVNSQFVAVGYGGAVIYSADGSSWSDASYTQDTSAQLNSVTYGPGGYVVIGADVNYNTFIAKRASLTSGSWAAPTTPPPSVAYNGYGLFVTYADGTYLGFYNDTNNEAYLLTSSDGNTWVQNDLNSTPLITGTTYAAGAFRLVGVYDFKGLATIAAAPGITSSLSASGTNGSAFTYTITASNSPTSFGASGLPTGLSVSTGSGIISGTPTVHGSYSVTISATNAAGSGSATLSLIIANSNTPPVFVGSTTTLLVGENSGATSITGLLHVSDSDSGQTETWSQSTAPAHGTLAFSGATASSGSANITPGGTITYTPSANYSGSDSFAVQVSDGAGGTAIRTITVTVNPPTGITSAITASGTYGSTFSYTITASNSPTSFGASGLPTGLTINTTSGAISGKPTQSGTIPVTISATNATSFGTATLTLNIAKVNLTVSGITASNKVYDGTTSASLNLTGASLNGVVNNDSISLNASGVVAMFADSNAGNGKTVTISGLTLAGTAAGNYTLTQPTASANITPAPATVTLNRSVQLYDGIAKSVTATTSPTGLPVAITYNGASTAPSSTGTYTVIGTVTNPNYSGSATNYLYVAVAPQFTNVQTNGAGILMSWSALPQVNYQLFYTESLQPISWNSFNGPVTATNTTMTTQDVIDPSQTMRLYRVQVILE
jgi:hypothetical protein